MRKTTLLWSLALVAVIIGCLTITTYYLGRTNKRKLVISTTTSLYDTGLLEAIEEEFENRYPIDLYVISVGTGQAIEHAKRGDADLIMVHAPPVELDFLTSGYGVCRKIIAYNFFVIVGPPEDPAGIEGLSARDALTRIVDTAREGKAFWISRGDESGTHLKEKALWVSAGFDLAKIREETWYIQSGTGMGRTLLIADGYTLSDLGTYLKYYMDKRIGLEIMVSGEEALLNVYSAIAVNPMQVHGVNFEDAVIFIKFLTSDQCQSLIEDFKKETYGQSLFFPAVTLLREDPNSTVARWIVDLAFFNGTECPQEYRNDHPELYG
ncbi:MAG: substrate-binding domain-containing protein [Candidatus Bathyarchaeia archaeon]